MLSPYDLLFLYPTAQELYDDRGGELAKSKKWDVYLRVLNSIIAGLLHPDFIWWIAAIFCLCIHFFLFDYLYNLFIGRRKDWFSYLGKTSKFDMMKWWVELGPWKRLAGRMIFLAGGLMAINFDNQIQEYIWNLF